MRVDFVSENVQNAYYAMLSCLLSDGYPLAPRGQATREIRACSLTIVEPSSGLLVSQSRGLNPYFASGELAWILAGSNRLAFIRRFNERWAAFSDDGETLHGAYGARMQTQLDHLVSVLANDPSSRQAVISIWNEKDRGSVVSKDKPCNTQLQFYQDHKGRLGLIATVRSQDIVFGFPYDTFNWTMIQKMVAKSLGWPVGEYRANFGSLHLYESHIDWTFDMLNARDFRSIDIPVYDLDTSRGMALRFVGDFTSSFESGENQYRNINEYQKKLIDNSVDPAFVPAVLKALEALWGSPIPDAYTFLSDNSWGPAVHAWEHRTKRQRPTVKIPEVPGG